MKRNIKLSVLFGSTALLGTMAQASTDYGPAIWRPAYNGHWYTSGYGHKFFVIHDMEGYYWSTISFFQRSTTSASVHYCVNGLKDNSTDSAPGEITQMVREAYYAWHACCWNKYSSGTEHEGFASNPAWYTEALYQASAGATTHNADKWGIAKDRNHIVGHNEHNNANWVNWVNCCSGFGMSPTCNTHTDPGPYWDWTHYMNLVNGVAYINPPYYFDADANGWTSGNSLSAIAWTGTGWPGIIYADQTGNDAFYYSPGTSYTGAAEATLNVSIYPQSGTTANHDMQVFWTTAASGSFSADKSSPIVSYTLQNNWARINLDINQAWPTYYNQNVTRLRLDMDNNNSATRWIVNHVITQSALRWRFDADPQGWVSANSLSAIAYSNSGWPGIIYADQTGDDPQFLSTGGWQMYGAINDTVHVRVYPQNGTTANHDMQIFFASGNENFFSEDKSLTTYYTAKDGWADVWFDFGTIGKWNGDYIRQIRLDVDQANQGNRWIIDSVTVEHNTSASYIHAPTVGQQPVGATINVGGSATFSVFPNGPAPFTYQWTFNGGNITGATAASYTKSNAQSTDAGNYACVISNSGGNVTSANAALTVNVPPSITTQPASQTVTAGANVTFSVVASGTAPLTYQWTFNAVNISGATASSYTKSNVQSVDAGNYAVVISNVAGNITSANAVLTVNGGGTPPSITTQPASQTVTAGANVTFSVTAAGTAPLSYQWRFNAGNIAGATLSSYTKSGVVSGDAGSYSVVVTNVAGTVTSADAVLTVNTPPSITTQPASQTVIVGANVTFSVTAAGTAPLSYQWRFNAGNIAGATLSSYTKSGVVSGDAGSYSVVVTNVVGTVTSANAVLTVNTPPSITTQPSSQTVNQGSTATFSVVAAGTAPLSYQWRFNAGNIAGATTSSYTKSNAQPADAGSYSVVVTNVAGTATSANAVLTVNYAPSITTQPASQTASPGANVTFSVVATGVPAPTYQWRLNAANITGATASSYTRNNVQSADVGYYSVVVNNTMGTVTSADASLTINDVVVFTDDFESGNLNNWTVAVSPATVLAISTAQHSSGVNSAYLDTSYDKMYHNLPSPVQGHAKFTVWGYDATGGGGTAGQTRWYGEVRAYAGGSYNNGGLNQLFAAGRYSIGFGTGTGTLASEVLNTTNYQGRLLTGANTGWFNMSGAATRTIGWHKFEIERLSDNATVNFYVDGALGRQITAATAAGLDDVTIGSAGSGTLLTADAFFDDVKMEYYDPPVITTQPSNQSANAGTTATLSVTASGTALTYQWRQNGVNVAGATSATLAISNVQQANAGTYSVVVQNGAGPVTSANATLTVVDVAPSISTQPQGQTVNPGSSATFTVVASGTTPLSYQWRLNTVNISGATASSYTRSNVQSGDTGSYSVVVSNPIGNTTSADAVLLLNNVPPSITTQPASQTVTAGTSVTFSVVAAGSAPLSYQWRKNAATISGATASSYTITSPQSTDAGSYSVVVTNFAGTVTSADAVLTVHTPASITTQPNGQMVNQGSSATFSVVAAGDAPLSYQWRFNAATISGATLSSYTKSNCQPADAGSYSVIVTNAYGSVTSADAVLIVNTAPVITTQPASQTVAPGANVTYSVVASGTAPLSYQWRLNQVAISGATLASYTRNNVQTADVGYYSVIVSNLVGTATSADAALVINDAVVFADTFESGNLNNWTVAVSPATVLAISTAQNHTAGGANSALVASSLNKMYHNITGTAAHSKYTFWGYDADGGTGAQGQTRWFGEVRSYTGGTYNNGSLSQLFAAGRYSVGLGTGTGTFAGEVVNDAKYQGRCLAGSNTGWFNLINAANRSLGWHKFEIERLADGTTINYSVDGTQGRQATAATVASWNVAIIGSLGSGTAVTANAWYDDVSVDYYDLPTISVQPASQTIATGSPVTFSVTAAGNVSSYQWRFNGVNIAGATASSYTIAAVNSGNAGSYTVVVSNSAGPVTSSVATLTVN